MFDVGFWELALIGVVALLVVGPERLPRLAREVGLWVGRIRRYADHVRREIEREVQDAGVREARQALEKPKLDDVYETLEDTKQAVREAERELNEIAAEDAAPKAGAEGEGSPRQGAREEPPAATSTSPELPRAKGESASHPDPGGDEQRQG